MKIPYESFWKMNPRILNIYRLQYEEEEQKNADMIDYSAWLNGRYVMRAIAACIDKKNKYPEAPFGKSTEEETSDVAAAKFSAWAKRFNEERDK